MACPRRWLWLIGNFTFRIWFEPRIRRVLMDMNDLRMEHYGLELCMHHLDDEIRCLEQRVSDAQRDVWRASQALQAARSTLEPLLVPSAAGALSPGGAVDQVWSALEEALDKVDDALKVRRESDQDFDLCVF